MAAYGEEDEHGDALSPNLEMFTYISLPCFWSTFLDLGFNWLHCHPVLSVVPQVRGVFNLWDARISPMLCYTSGELFFDWWSWVVCSVSMLYTWRFNFLGVLLWGCTFLHLELHFFNIKGCGSWVVSQTGFSGFFWAPDLIAHVGYTVYSPVVSNLFEYLGTFGIS
jgi:hypothetical protein